MEKNRARIVPLRFCTLGVCLCVLAISLVHSDATSTRRKYMISRKHLISTKRIHNLRKFDMNMLLDSSNIDPYISPPFPLQAYDAHPPFSLPENTPAFCPNLPSPPQPPSSTIPTPIVGPPSLPSPSPESPIFPNPPPIVPSPPQNTPNPNPPPIVPIPESPMLSPPQNSPNPTTPTTVPSPPSYEPSPPSLDPSPPSYEPSPPSYGSGPPSLDPSPPSFEPSPPSLAPTPPYITIPSPSGSIPSPRFLPPIVFPQPTVPPPPHNVPSTAMWCVAKASVPDPIIEEAMNYACGSGADCNDIQANGSCFEPNTLYAHASYAFNSYWQRTKVGGGTCDFGGTAILVTVDPSFDGCQFIYF